MLFPKLMPLLPSGCRATAIACALLFTSLLSLHGADSINEPAATIASESFQFAELPPLPEEIRGGFGGTHDDTLIVAGGEAGRGHDIFVMEEKSEAWQRSGTLDAATAWGASASTDAGLILIGGLRDGIASAQVTQLSWGDGSIQQSALPELPFPLSHATAATQGSTIYLAGGLDDRGVATTTFLSYDFNAKSPEWTILPAWPGSARSGAALAASQGQLFLIGGEAKGVAQGTGFSYNPNSGWTTLAEIEDFPKDTIEVPYGHSHIFLLGGSDRSGQLNTDILAYHTITNTLVTLSQTSTEVPAGTVVTKWGNQVMIMGNDQTRTIRPTPVETGYNWLDHSVVILYMVAMVYMGFYFSKREKSSADFFRGGNRIPWWASGMSLFATGASAISLMAMPGKSFATNWTYLTISFYTVLVLPISMLFLAPLVRRLKISTANEYLERRFGLTVRLFASVIFIFTQVVGRMASVMLLPAIALSAITGMEVQTCIIIMGVITTVYTYFGGLEAVIWTDTVQGFIMIASIGGCLILALNQLGMNPTEMWTAANAGGKFHMFDFSWDLTYPTAIIFFLSTAVVTLGGIGDQNFVQRVQCTPDMRQTKLAVATQLAVAIPINLLLFALGTALYLFYQVNPTKLDPTMSTDGIYPFFVAQQLPPGLSGLVVAALFAATMSTVSSSICSVSDLGVQDFYRRFNKRATDHSSLVLARILTAVIGMSGMTAALLLSYAEVTSIWDLAILVIGLIGSGIAGLFMLGLLTTRANESGAIFGIVVGLLLIVYLRNTSPISFWLYGTIGSATTFITGYLASLILPGKVKPLEGLTVYTQPKRQ